MKVAQSVSRKFQFLTYYFQEDEPDYKALWEEQKRTIEELNARISGLETEKQDWKNEKGELNAQIEELRHSKGNYLGDARKYNLTFVRLGLR